MRAIVVLLVLLITSEVEAQSIQRDVLLFPKNGEGFSARLVEVSRDSIVVLAGSERRYAKSDISRITAYPRKEGSRGFLTGALLGIYAINLWLASANEQPGLFAWRGLYGSDQSDGSGPFGVFGIDVIGTLVGGGIGYIVDAAKSDDPLQFIFSGGSDQRDAEWAELEQKLAEPKPRLHLSVSGGYVSTPIHDAYLNQMAPYGGLESSGRSYYTYYSTGHNMRVFDEIQPATRFNMARRIALSYSYNEHIELGVSYAVLSEPASLFSTNNNYSSQDSIQRDAGEIYSGKGYYATGTYGLLFGETKNYEWDATLGVGLADVNFDLYTQKTIDRSGHQIIGNYSGGKHGLSAMLSTSISAYLSPFFSLGLAANYFYVGKQTAPAIPAVGFTEQTLDFSNYDIGFILGLHF